MNFRPTAYFLLLLVNGCSVFGQSKPEQAAPPAQDAATTTSASLYFTAGSKEGLLVKELTPEDLTLTEDKVPAKIERVICGQTTPVLLGILLDVSGSRRGDPLLSSHYDALVNFLGQFLTGDDATYVAAFNNKYYKLSEVTADRAVIKDTFERLKQTLPVSSTAM